MTVRVAVIGVGSMGASHARVYSTLPDAGLVAVCDADSARAADVAARFKTEALCDYRRLEGRVDAVSVAVPTTAHAEVCRFFLERGVSVLVEKPMTRTSAEAAELVSLSEESGAHLMVGHIERFNPAFMAIGEMNLRPLFIECDRISPFKFRCADVGVVFDLMIHDIDIILHLAKSQVSRIDACGVSVMGIHEDVCNARFVFETGCVANVTASRVSTRSMRKIRIFCHDCYVTVDTGARQTLVYRRSEKLNVEIARMLEAGATSLAGSSGLSFPELLDVTEVKLDDHEPLAKELAAFLKSVKTGEVVPVTGREGLDAIRVAEQVVKASVDHAQHVARQ